MMGSPALQPGSDMTTAAIAAATAMGLAVTMARKMQSARRSGMEEARAALIVATATTVGAVITAETGTTMAIITTTIMATMMGSTTKHEIG
jgi:hypothetical protein